MNNLVKPIKSALSKEYGYKNVSVKNGRGTAWGWVEASISLPKPIDCGCSINEHYCQSCKDKVNKITKEGTEIAREALKKDNLSFHTYCSDDGFGTDREEFLLQINLI